MFYIKENIAEGMTLEVELTGEAFTRCPDCGAEQKIDLVHLIRNSPDFDFYGVSIYCESCTKKRKNMEATAQTPAT